MRIGVYLGTWSLTRLGGMGVYLQNLLAGAAEAVGASHELALLVDRTNRAAMDELGVDLPTVWLDRPDWGDLPAAQRREVIRVRRLSYPSPTRADALRNRGSSEAVDSFLWGLDDAVSASGIDLLYFTIPPYLKRPRVPVLLTIHDLKHLHRPQDHDAADLARRRRWRRVARSADLVYASYEHVRRDIERRFGVRRDRTAVLPLAAPAELFGAGPSAIVSAEWRLPMRFALMPAQFWPHKNHARVIEAIADLRRKNMDVPLICTGQTLGECAVHAAAMRRLADRLGVADLVRQLGHVDRATVRALYRSAHMVIVATLYDPGSFPAMEAMAMGRPLVASRVTSIPETVGDAALLVDPQSVSELTGAIGRLWTDDALCESLRRRGPRRISPRSWLDVGRDWLSLCERAVGKARAPARAVVHPVGIA